MALCIVIYCFFLFLESGLFGLVADEADWSLVSLNAEPRSTSSLPPDSNNNENDASVKDDDDVDDWELITTGCESHVTDEERREAMLAAMDASTVRSAHQPAGQQRPGLELSVEACLARFTDNELLCGANMIACDNCTRAAAAAACNSIDHGNNSAASIGDSSTSSKTNGSGMFDFIAS